RAARAVDQQLVPFRIEAPEPFGCMVLDTAFELVLKLLQARAVLIGCRDREISGGDALEHRPGAIDLAYFLEAGAAHRRPPEGLDIDETFGGQPLKRLAHLQPAAAGLADDVDLHEPLLGGELTPANPLSNPVGDLDARGRFV